MNEYSQPGLHPDPDSLSAFIEGALPEHERVACVAHLAECSACREVVYLAQEPLVPEVEPLPVAPEKISFWTRWFRPAPVLAFATAAGILVVSLSLYEHLRSIPKAPVVMAVATPPPASAPALAQVPRPEIETEKTPRVVKRAAPIAPKDLVTQPEQEAKIAPSTPPPPPTVATAPMASPAAAAPAPLAASAPPPAPAKPATEPTGVAGKITDTAGGAIAGAAVNLRPLAGSIGEVVTSDPKGQFDVAGLEPGRYEMQVTARGFQQATKQIDVVPNQVARADSTLSVGAVTETISVTAQSAAVQTLSSNRSALAGGGGGGGRGGRGGAGGGRGGSGRAVSQTAALAPERSKVPLSLDGTPAATTVTKGKVTLTIDPTGALLLSENAGKKWKSVKNVWGGKVTGLVALASAVASDPSFQLTTDTGAVWLSRDGSHWYAALK